jgi:hypothetical protein
MKRGIIITYDVRANEIMRGWAGEAEPVVTDFHLKRQTSCSDRLPFKETDFL